MTAKTYRAEPDTEETPQDVTPETQADAPENVEAEAPAEDLEVAMGADDSQLQVENQELRDRLTRAMAETENVRRRVEKERKDALKYANSSLAKDILGVVDNLRRALDSVPAEEVEENETLKNLTSGVEMTEKELLTAFEKHGITQIAVQPGDRFDPHYHEAMFEVPTTEQPNGSIVHILQNGYMLHDRLLRPARVGVAKNAGGGQGNGGNGVDTSA